MNIHILHTCDIHVIICTCITAHSGCWQFDTRWGYIHGCACLWQSCALNPHLNTWHLYTPTPSPYTPTCHTWCVLVLVTVFIVQNILFTSYFLLVFYVLLKVMHRVHYLLTFEWPSTFHPLTFDLIWPWQSMSAKRCVAITMLNTIPPVRPQANSSCKYKN